MYITRSHLYKYIYIFVGQMNINRWTIANRFCELRYGEELLESNYVAITTPLAIINHWLTVLWYFRLMNYASSYILRIN